MTQARPSRESGQTWVPKRKHREELSHSFGRDTVIRSAIK